MRRERQQPGLHALCLQREPQAGEAATEPTSVRIVYDQTTLYIGAELSDSAPDTISASELGRDNTLESDDTFSVLLDTCLDHRNASLFRVNARGTRFDALIQERVARHERRLGRAVDRGCVRIAWPVRRDWTPSPRRPARAASRKSASTI